MTWICTLCQELACCSRKAPIISDTPMGLWKKLGTDPLMVDGKHFLLISDHFSKYPIITPIHATTSKIVMEEMKKMM